MKKQVLNIGVVSALTILCVAMFMRNAPHLWDIQFWDETFYMGTGIFSWDNHFRFYEVSPLYSYIYRMASPFFSDPAALHIWMGVTVTAAAIMSTALAVFIISRNAALSAVTVVIMIASGYSDALPKLVYAAIPIVSLGFAASTMLPRLHTKMALIALTAFIVTFIRPEFVVAFYLATAVSIIALAASFRTVSKDRLWVGITLVSLAIIAVLSKLWIFPVLKGGERALMAFGQHYSLYLREMGIIEIDPFSNYERILAEYLPGATSEMSALVKYPAKIIGYFSFNIANGIKAGFSAIAGIAINYPILAFAILTIIAYCIAKRKRGVFNYGDAASWLVLAAPTAMSIVLIYARDHYLVVAATLMMLAAAFVFRWVGPRDTIIGAAGVLMLSALLIKPLQPVDQLRLETTTALKAQKPFGSLLEMDGGWCYYAPKNCHSIYALEVKTDSMVRYINEGHINGVMASEQLLRWAKEANQPDFVNFINNGAEGWTKIPLSKDYTLIRRDRLDMIGWGNVLTSNVMKYVHVNHIGAGSGTVSKRNDSVVFVHPGDSDPTSLSIDLGRLARDISCSRINVTATIDKNVTPEAIARGGAVIGVTFDDGRGQSGVVSSGHTMTFASDTAPTSVTVLVDDHGSTDTDWLNLDIQPVDCAN